MHLLVPCATVSKSVKHRGVVYVYHQGGTAQVVWVLCRAASKRKTSYSANVSFTLMCTSIQTAAKSAAALKTLNDLKGPRTISPHPRDEASLAPVSLVEWYVASYHDAPSYGGALPAMCAIRPIGLGLSGPRSWLLLLYPPCGGTSRCVCTYGRCTNWQVERQRTCLCTSRSSARDLRRKSTHL